MIPGTVRGMKALIQKSITTSWSSAAGAGGGVGSRTAGPGMGTGMGTPIQHCTSFGPGQRPVMKVPPPPEQVDPEPGLLRQVPACPVVLVHDFVMQHFIPTGSLGQAFVIVKPGGKIY